MKIDTDINNENIKIDKNQCFYLIELLSVIADIRLILEDN